MAAVKRLINESDNIVFFGGAGVSTESGIPVPRVWTDCIIRNIVPAGADHQSQLLHTKSGRVLPLL